MATKKKTDIEIVVPLLTTKTKAVEVPKLKISGLEKLTSAMRKRNSQIEDLEAQQKLDENVLLGRVKEERINEEKKGQFFKCILVDCQEPEAPVKVQFQNKWKKLQPENEPVLRQLLGKVFDFLFAPAKEIKLRENADMNQLKDLLGERFEVFFEVESVILAQDELMEKRAKLRSTLDEKTNSVLDQVLSQLNSKPAVSFK